MGDNGKARVTKAAIPGKLRSRGPLPGERPKKRQDSKSWEAATYRAFGSASVEEILGDRIKDVKFLEANTLDSMIFLNRGDHFEGRPLPVEAQFAPAFGLCVADFDGDSRQDVFLTQNFFGVKPEESRYDGGVGLLLRGNGNGDFSAVAPVVSGIQILINPFMFLNSNNRRAKSS